MVECGFMSNIEENNKLQDNTYQNKKYTLGSIHSEKLWNQHRNILAFWGTKEQPIALNVKCLHDGWDYCSCLTSTVQDKGKTLTTFGFLTDQGDTHVTLDMVKDKKIEAEDLRVSWQFYGNVQHHSVRIAPVQS